jgi:hypothetical protein
MPDFEDGRGTCLDRILIQELVHRYSDALCQRDHDAWVATLPPMAYGTVAAAR